MNKLRKKALSLLLVIVMIVSLFPAAAWAVSEPEPNAWVQEKIDKYQSDGYLLTGPTKIGSSDLYQYNLFKREEKPGGGYITKTVYIILPGEGAINPVIPNYDGVNTGQPWAEDFPTAIYIADGVTGIGNHAFNGNYTLSTLEIEDPGDLTRVGEYAFYGCSRLAYSVDNPLNLSNVTELGQYAFSGCNSLRAVTLGEGLEEIPQYAFNSCGLVDIDIPTTVTSIGDYAFSYNSFSQAGELELHEGLKTIGSHAFYREVGSNKNSGFTAVTIPSTVTSIGDYAFYAHRQLKEVTVVGSNVDESNPSKLNNVGDAAFGTDNYSAYAELATIADAKNPSITYTGEIGTMINLPKEISEKNLFINGDTCYTGNITPLTYERTDPPTCTVAGYDEYSLTVSGAMAGEKPVKVYYRYPILALGHDWGGIAGIKEKPASCTLDGYFYQECSRCKTQTAVMTSGENNALYDDNGDKLSAEKLAEYEAKIEKHTGHQYEPDSIDNPIIATGQKTILYYYCANKAHDEDRDDILRKYPVTLTGKTLTALTTDTLSSIAAQLNGISNSGNISWKDEDLNTEFAQEGEHYAKVEFTPTSMGIFTNNAFSVDKNGNPLQITINVEKAPLDLSQFAFSHHSVSVDLIDTTEVKVSGLLDGATQNGSIEFYDPASDNWSTSIPKTTGSDYEVRVPIDFNTDMYRIPQSGEDEYLTDDSTIGEVNGQYYIVHSFAVTIKSINAQITAIPNLVYSGSAQDTVHVSQLRENCEVTFYLKEGDNWVEKGTFTSTQAGSETNGIKLTNAGSYQVKVEVTLKDFETQTQELTVNIAKQPVTKPQAKNNIIYLPQVEQQGFDSLGGDGELYTITNGKGIDADEYTATATLNDAANYRWRGEADTVASIKIPWTISARMITKPTPTAAITFNYSYGVTHSPTRTTALADYAYTFTADDVKHVYYIGDSGQYGHIEDAYTVTNARGTNAGDYESVITLNESGNYLWSGGSSEQITVPWQITPAELELPIISVTAPSETYDGLPYDAEYIQTAATPTLPADVINTGYEYAANQSFTGGVTTNAPVNVGSYYVRNKYEYDAGNYYVTKHPNASFTITKVKLTLEQPQDQTETYSAGGVAIQTPGVASGIVEADSSKPLTDLFSYTYSYKYKGPNDDAFGNDTTADANTKFKNFGEYQVTIGIDGTNYEADAVTYTLEITAAEQTITLNPDGSTTISGSGTADAPYTVTKTLGDAPFTITGEVSLDSSNVIINYVTSEEQDTTSDEEDIITVENGKVTIHNAGTATVTVKASQTANVNAAETFYNLTVNKATPTIDVSEYSNNALEKTYTANPIAGYELATITGVGNNAPAPTGTPTYKFYTDQTCATEVTENGGIPSAVSTYYLQISYDGDKNYTAAESKVITVTIKAADLAVDIEGYSGTYDGTEHYAATVNNVTGTGTIGSYDVYYAVTDDNTQPAEDSQDWKNELKVKNVADSNKYYWYKVVAPNHDVAIGSFTVNIAPAALSISGEPSSYSKVYDGNPNITEDLNAIQISAAGVNGETIDIDSASGSYKDKNARSEKDVTIILTLDGANDWGNYKYGDNALTEGKITLTKSKAGTIEQKEITVTADSIKATDKIYDGTATVNLTGTPTSDDFIPGDNAEFAAITTQTGNAEDANVGTKTITVTKATLNSLLSGADKDNYIVTADYTTTAKITARTVYLLFLGQQGDGWSTEVPYSTGGLTSQLAKYQVSAKAKDDTTGFVNNDKLESGDITYTFANEQGEPVTNPTNLGTYKIKAEIASTSASKFSNYSIAAINSTVQIVQNNDYLTVNITPAANLVYNGLGQDPIAGITVTGGTEELQENNGYNIAFSLNDSGSYNLSREQLKEQIKDAKEYTVYWQVTTTNYGNKADSFTINVAQAELALSRDVTASRAYNGTNEAEDQVKDVEITGLKNGEQIDVACVDAVYNAATVADAKNITITYSLTPQGSASLANYTVSINGNQAVDAVASMEETVSGSITKAAVSVTIENQEAVYSGQMPTVDQTKWSTSDTIYQLDGQNNDNLLITLSIPEGSKNVGEYTISGTSGNGNYDVAFTEGKYNITHRPISIDIGDEEGVYGDEPDLSQVTLTDDTTPSTDAGLASGESMEQFRNLISTTATATSVVGDYDISGTGGEQGNYDITFTSGKYTINQRPITITIVDKESYYGCALAQLECSAAYTGGAGKAGIVNGDNLGINLTTTAIPGSDVGDYDITGTASNAANYYIVWDNGTYTIKKATLVIDFTNATVNVSMGSTVDNPLKFINASNSNKELLGKPDDVVVKYTSNNPSVATVEETTGAVTIIAAGDTTITAEVTSGGINYIDGARDSYELRVATAGTGIQVNVQANNLTYTGEPQKLVTGTVLTPSDAKLEYSLSQSGPWSEDVPTGINAGDYTVYWQASRDGYTTIDGNLAVNIKKANPSTGFSSATVNVAYEEGKIFNSTTETTLKIHAKYQTETGEAITYLSDNTQVAKVNNNDLATIALNGTGNATIRAQFAETDNFNAQTVSFTLVVGNASTMIDYTADNYEVTYDGQAHGSKITVNSPSNYTIKYSNNQGGSYDLTESPTVTNVADSPLTIHFQIQANGYTSASGIQTVTINPKTITENDVTGVANSYTYIGQQITTPNLTVTDGGTLLAKGVDYKVEYGKNTDVGESPNDPTLANGGGYVKVTGIGNYTGEVVKYFAISAVESDYLTAELNRYFGYYDDSNTNNATVTVKHGDHEVTTDGNDTVTITVENANEGDDYTINDQTLTFLEAGVYTIEVAVEGAHKGSFSLKYTLLPQNMISDDFEIAGLAENIVTYDGNNYAFAPVVSAEGNALTANTDYTLSYSYTPFAGGAIDNADYDPANTEMTEAGLYVVTVTGVGNYSGKGTITLLINQRDLTDGIIAEFIPDSFTYNKSEQEPAVELTYNGETVGDLNPTQYYNNINAGEAMAVSSAAASNNNFRGSRADTFAIAPKELTDVDFTAIANPDEYNFTGQVVVPTIEVTDNTTGTKLALGTDYTISSPADAINPGTYEATVIGSGNYAGEIEVPFTIISDPGQPVVGMALSVNPAEWSYGDTVSPAISVTFNGAEMAENDYTLRVERDGTELVAAGDKDAAVASLVEPGSYTIKATGTGAYIGSEDIAYVTIKKIKPTVTVTANPTSLSGAGTVSLTLSGSNLPANTDLTALLSVNTLNTTALDLSKLTWTEANGQFTADFSAANANETYTFTLNFPGDNYYETVTDTAIVVTARRTSGGGGGGGGGAIIQPPKQDKEDEDEDRGIADPRDTGVANWLLTEEHIQYLGGYGNGIFGPTENMTRAEVAQMFYNLLLEKDVPITVYFTDVPSDAWYAKAVNTLASLEIIYGVGDGKYAPDKAITRAEFTVIAMRFAKLDASAGNIFSDVKPSDWFYAQVIGSAKYGWISGYTDGTFRPNNTITRAEVTAIVNRMLGRDADKVFVVMNADELKQFVDVSQYSWAYYDIMEATNAHKYTITKGTENWLELQ